MAVSELTFRTELLRMARGYWMSQVLFAAADLRIFETVARDATTAEEIARTRGTDLEATRRLLNGCVAVGLLTKSSGRYRNAPIAEALLVPGRPGYLGHWIALMHRFYGVWGKLPEALLTGKPVGLPAQAGPLEDTEAFALAMHEFALANGREFADRVELAGRRRLLDVGGGVGSYAMMLVQRYPDLAATVFDVAPMVELAKRVIAQAGLENRITTSSGDYGRDRLGTGYDAALLSNVLHQEDVEVCRRILRSVFDALEPGALVMIHGIHVNQEGTGPQWPALQSLLQMLLWGGRVYSVEETVALLADTGFRAATVVSLSLLNGGTIISAERPIH